METTVNVESQLLMLLYKDSCCHKKNSWCYYRNISYHYIKMTVVIIENDGCYSGL